MSTVYLLTGSNIGNRERQLHRAGVLVGSSIGKVVAASAVFETAPWGNEQQPAFLNQALAVQTTLLPEMVLLHIHQIEQQMGRVRAQKWGSRRIDIDILLFDDIVLNTPRLTIPHPLLPQRRFALTPLAELIPHVIHPVLQTTIAQLLQNCPDELPVTYFAPPPQ